MLKLSAVRRNDLVCLYAILCLICKETSSPLVVNAISVMDTDSLINNKTPGSAVPKNEFNKTVGNKKNNSKESSDYSPSASKNTTSQNSKEKFDSDVTKLSKDLSSADYNGTQNNIPLIFDTGQKNSTNLPDNSTIADNPPAQEITRGKIADKKASNTNDQEVAVSVQDLKKNPAFDVNNLFVTKPPPANKNKDTSVLEKEEVKVIKNDKETEGKIGINKTIEKDSSDIDKTEDEVINKNEKIKSEVTVEFYLPNRTESVIEAVNKKTSQKNAIGGKDTETDDKISVLKMNESGANSSSKVEQTGADGSGAT